MIPLDDYCPRPLNGEQIVGAELVLDDYLTVDAAFIPEPEAITEPLCARSTDASAPAVPPCEPEAIATVVGNGEGAGQHDNQRLVLMNTGRYGDCVMPRDTTLTLTDAEGRPVEAPGPEGSFTGEPLPLEGDLVRAGGAAEMWVAYGTSTDDTSCLSGDGGAPVGPVTASIRLPGGDVRHHRQFRRPLRPELHPPRSVRRER